MVTRKHILAVLSFVLIAAFALSACQPVVQTVTVVETVEVEKPVEVVTTQEVTVVETQIVEVEKEAFTTPHPILGDLESAPGDGLLHQQTRAGPVGIPADHPRSSRKRW